MNARSKVAAPVIERYLRARPRLVRWREWLWRRRYRLTQFPNDEGPLLVLAHPSGAAPFARLLARSVEEDWSQVPAGARALYGGVLEGVPGLVVVQLVRKNVCGCLGHRHVLVTEEPFAVPHDAFGGVPVGEVDIAYERVRNWQPLPLSDTALDTRFLVGTRLDEFRSLQFRLRLLSVLLHEMHHLVSPQAPESEVRGRSISFYRDALADYVERATSSLSFTIDRSFSRFG
jgi:hypothetical protein